MISWFPCIVCHGVAFPFDQVLKSLFLTEVSVIYDFFDFKLLEVVHEVWGRSHEVVPVLWSFTIRSQQGGVEYVMDGPGRRELQFVGHCYEA